MHVNAYSLRDSVSNNVVENVYFLRWCLCFFVSQIVETIEEKFTPISEIEAILVWISGQSEMSYVCLSVCLSQSVEIIEERFIC